MKHRISCARISVAWLFVLGSALLPRPALANFHIMEIEQVIGGVSGDTSAQAVQLKMRADGQNVLAGQALLIVRDAAGNNPVTLSTFPAPNPTAGPCREILLVTPAMASKTSPAVTGAYTMTPIPAAYLAAGSLTFEGFGSAYWRVSWGGAGYTGPQTVVAGINDSDGVTSPAFAGALPSTSAKALAFTPACPALSTTNAADYAPTAGAAVLKNNALATFTVVAGPAVQALPDIARFLLVATLGLGVVTFAFKRRSRA